MNNLPTPGSMVKVIWSDIVSQDSWLSEHEMHQEKLATVHTLGYLIYVDSSVIKVSSTYIPEDKCGGVITIPMSVVSEVIELNED